MGKKGRTAEVVVYLQKGLALHPLVLAASSPVLASPSPPERGGDMAWGSSWRGRRAGVGVIVVVEVAWRGVGRSSLGWRGGGRGRGGVAGAVVVVVTCRSSWSLTTWRGGGWTSLWLRRRGGRGCCFGFIDVASSSRGVVMVVLSSS